jgi:hypothetical protein
LLARRLRHRPCPANEDNYPLEAQKRGLPFLAEKPPESFCDPETALGSHMNTDAAHGWRRRVMHDTAKALFSE